ncbi:MAG: HEAT repeat domain-containing protein [Chromatiales bacterium]
MIFLKQTFNSGNALLNVVVVLLAITASAFLIGRFFLAEESPPPRESKQERQTVSVPSQTDLLALAERAGSPPPLTAEQIEEDAQIDEEQVALARQWLKSADSRQRVDGAEQLAAYPTHEAEMLLTATLATDPDPQVRSAAAQSLEEFEETTEQTIAALLAALQDVSEEVQMSAWTALEGIALKEEDGSVRSGLRKMATSPRLAADTQQAILEFLKDRSPETP